jgi:hypothetical protein
LNALCEVQAAALTDATGSVNRTAVIRFEGRQPAAIATSQTTAEACQPIASGRQPFAMEASPVRMTSGDGTGTTRFHAPYRHSSCDTLAWTFEGGQEHFHNPHLQPVALP